MTVKPWIGYITVMDLDHDDAVRIEDGPVMIDLGMMQLVSEAQEYKVPQGIVAGAVVETGEGVPDLAPGSKVYYAGKSAIVIGEYKVVHTNYVVAFEEAPR